MPPRPGQNTAPEEDVPMTPRRSVMGLLAGECAEATPQALPAVATPAAVLESVTLSDCLDELGRRLGLPLADGAATDERAIMASARVMPMQIVGGDDATETQVGAFLRALSPEDHNDLWVRVVEVTSEYLNPDLFSREDGARRTNKVAMHVGTGVSRLLASFAENVLDSLPAGLPPAFVEAASLCQELILVSAASTQGKIFDALERICEGGFEGCEQFYGALMMWLLGKCAAPKVSAADVSHLYKLRSLLPELDWDHESIDSLKQLVLRCTANSGFVLKSHGPDMISIFYTINAGFTPDINLAVKNQVPHCNTKTLQAYGMGIWKALHLAQDDIKDKVEACVQDWVLLAIRASRKSAEKARVILEEIHRHHLKPLERELLAKCYGPVLWRGLKVANWQVRENAAKLLEPTYPLHRADLTVEQQELEMMTQLRFLRESLEDTNESVRRAGINAACLIMKNFWDFLPTHEKAQLLNVLKDRCINEKKSPSVRAAVADGIATLLENPLTHPTMEGVLHEVGPSLLHDRSPIVRSSFVTLMATISQCRAIPTQRVVSHEELYLSLVGEHALSQADWAEKEIAQVGSKRGNYTGIVQNQVAQGMTKLMAHTLFGANLPEQVQRCYELLKKFPLALLALLSNAGEVVPLPDRVKLGVALFNLGRKELQKALEGAAQGGDNQPLVTILEVAGLLLEGIPAANQKRKTRKGRSTDKEDEFPVELEQFVYENIKQEDILPALHAHKAERDSTDRLWADCLFTLSSLDPEKLPRVADLVRCELHAACRGVSDAQISDKRLMALMRTAARWDLLCDAVEPTWQRLLGAASRIFAGQHVTQDMTSTLAITDAVFRDPQVRTIILAANAEIFSKVVQKLATAFCNAWVHGLEKLATRKGTEQAVLGPASEWWPQILGLVIRIAQHLQCQMSNTASEVDPSADVHACPAAEVQAQICSALSSRQAVECLQELELAADATSSGPRPAKRPRSVASLSPPTDIDLVLQIYGRALEALNASRFLQPLQSTGLDSPGDNIALEQKLHDMSWRWAHAADQLRPLEGESRLSKAWVSSGHLFKQVIRSRIPKSQVISISKQLLGQITDDVPAEHDDMRLVVNTLMHQFQFVRSQDKPQVDQFIQSLLREAGSDCTETGGSDQFEVCDRLRTLVIEDWKGRLQPGLLEDRPLKDDEPVEDELGVATHAPVLLSSASAGSKLDSLFMKSREAAASPLIRSGGRTPVPSPCRS